MSSLLIPIAPLSRTKSRLRDCFSLTQLKELTINMFKDLGITLKDIDYFDNIIVYSNDEEILELAGNYNLIGVKEILTTPRKNFDTVIDDLNKIAIKKFNAKYTIFTFLDTILISKQNFYEINNLIKHKELLVCPAIHSAGISILGRNPPDIMPSYFSDPTIPSFIAQIKIAKELGIKKIAIYDSFRAGFDIDIKQDLILAYEYLKILQLTYKNTYKFLKNNFKFNLKKSNTNNNREFRLIKD